MKAKITLEHADGTTFIKEGRFVFDGVVSNEGVMEKIEVEMGVISFDLAAKILATQLLIAGELDEKLPLKAIQLFEERLNKN